MNDIVKLNSREAEKWYLSLDSTRKRITHTLALYRVNASGSRHQLIPRAIEPFIIVASVGVEARLNNCRDFGVVGDL